MQPKIIVYPLSFQNFRNKCIEKAIQRVWMKKKKIKTRLYAVTYSTEHSVLKYVCIYISIYRPIL